MRSAKSRWQKGGLKNYLLLVAGFFLLGLGLIGLVLPVLPTTPFLLLSAACFGRSSRKLYVYLHCNRLFGKALRSYRYGRGVERKTKIRAMITTGTTIGISLFFMLRASMLKLSFLLLVIAVIVLFHIAILKEPSKKIAVE